MTPANIDVLCCAVADIEPALLADYEKLLSEEEIIRLRSFRSVSGAKEFLVGRALLRTALAERLNCDPRQLQFSKNEHGKPLLSVPHSNWQFNLTHSHDWVAVALCEGASVGIDIEAYRRRNNLVGIAKRFFSKEENAQLAQCNENEWLDIFFAIWTLKEAHAKALGCGLPKILNCSSVSVNLAMRTIAFMLSGVAATAAAISSWLVKFDEECMLAVVAHRDGFSQLNVSRCIPTQSIRPMTYKILAHGI